MLLNVATLSLLLTVVSAPDSVRRVLSSPVAADSGRVTPRDSTPPLGRRTMARVGFAAETGNGVAIEQSADAPIDTTQRRHAVEYSDWYYKRLTIHKAASYATIPLFAAEYVLGDKLYNGTASSSTRSAHQAVAAGIGVLFGVNTVTGVWNLWESRHESEGRARRTTHAVLMLAADAGFVATAALAPEGEEDSFEANSNDRSRHRAVAVTSMGVSLASYLMMYFWK
jgi:hypothetical protein